MFIALIISDAEHFFHLLISQLYFINHPVYVFPCSCSYWPNGLLLLCNSSLPIEEISPSFVICYAFVPEQRYSILYRRDIPFFVSLFSYTFSLTPFGGFVLFRRAFSMPKLLALFSLTQHSWGDLPNKVLLFSGQQNVNNNIQVDSIHAEFHTSRILKMKL